MSYYIRKRCMYASVASHSAFIRSLSRVEWFLLLVFKLILKFWKFDIHTRKSFTIKTRVKHFTWQHYSPLSMQMQITQNTCLSINSFLCIDIYDNCMRLIKRICHVHPNAKPRSKPHDIFFFCCSEPCAFFIDLHIAFYSRMWYQDRLGSGDRQFGIHCRQKRQERNKPHDRGQLRHAQGTCKKHFQAKSLSLLLEYKTFFKSEAILNLKKKTKMHSSRMRTARSSSRHGGGGGSPHTPQSRHTPSGAGTPRSRNPPLKQAPPCGQTDTCKNITLANFVCGR